MNLSEKYQRLSREVAAADARLVIVTKTHPVSTVQSLYDLGHRSFGENRVSELMEKYEALPKDIDWHFIGHLQRNKVQDVLPLVKLIHSGDSLRLLREIDKRSGDLRTDVLLQFHIAREESKYGLTRQSGELLMEEILRDSLQRVRITGVMGMATYTDNTEQLNSEFRSLHEIFGELKQKYFAEDPSFSEISMGMSGDYATALTQGSTIVRIGSLLLGDRPQPN